MKPPLTKHKLSIRYEDDLMSFYREEGWCKERGYVYFSFCSGIVHYLFKLETAAENITLEISQFAFKGSTKVTWDEKAELVNCKKMHNIVHPRNFERLHEIFGVVIPPTLYIRVYEDKNDNIGSEN